MAAGTVLAELRWLANVLSGHPNPLRRPVDLWAARVTAALLVLALGTLPLAALVGHGTHQRMLGTIAEQESTHQEVSARLLEPARQLVTPGAHPQVRLEYEAAARWSDESGRSFTGTVVLGVRGEAGQQVPIWIDDRGRQTTPPLSGERALSSAISSGVLVVIGGGVLCAVAAFGVRVLAEMIGRSAWEREWEDGWTGRGPAGTG